MYGIQQRHYRDMAERSPVSEKRIQSSDTKPAQGGVQGYSTEAPYSSYAIFCVGQSIAKQAAFRSWAADHKIGFKSLQGMYKGQAEASFIINQDDLTECYNWYSQEESILVLGPTYRDGKLYGNRKAWLRYNAALEQYIGLYQCVSRATALRERNWTLDLTTGEYYICIKQEN